MVNLQKCQEPPSIHRSPLEDPEKWLEQVKRLHMLSYQTMKKHLGEGPFWKWLAFKAESRKTSTELSLLACMQHHNGGLIMFVEEL